MSKISLQPNVSGTGTFTIAAPNSNTDRTLTLPDAAGEVAVFASGTKMLFAQTTAPTGWTKDTTHNNKALRVVSGTAGSGGSLDFTTAFASRSTGSTAAGGTVADHTLTLAQTPFHTHQAKPEDGGTRWFSVFNGTDGTWPNERFGMNGTHTTSGAGGSGSHAHGFTGAAHSHSLDMQVQYVDIIIATKA